MLREAVGIGYVSRHVDDAGFLQSLICDWHAQVTTPGNELAAAYLHAEGLKMQRLAERHRPDLEVTVRSPLHSVCT